MAWVTHILKRILLSLIASYRLLISPWLGRSCRFEPTCSHYAQTAIQLHGPFQGTWMTVKRISRCHPWHPGGYDPVPENHASDKI